MEKLNESGSTIEDLKNENEILKSEKQILIDKLDQTEQQLHGTKLQLSTLKMMEQELLTEIDFLNNDKKPDEEKFIKRIKELEEKIAHLNELNVDQVKQFNIDFKEKELEIASLNEKLSSVDDEKSKKKDETINKLNNDIVELKLKNETLTFQIDENNITFEELNNKIEFLENKILDYETNIEEAKEFLAIKKAELEASNERYQNLQEEYIMTQMELNQMKTVPQDKAQKGNSLFAEVEDNRQKLKKYIQVMNKKYSELKAVYNKNTMTVQNLRSSLVELKTMKNENSNFEEDQARIIESHKKTVDDMMETIEALQKELKLRKELTDEILHGRQKSTEALIEVARKEVLELRDKLTTQTYSRMTSENALCLTRIELKKWRLEALSLQSEVLMLKQTVEELKINNSLPGVPNYEENDLPLPTSIKEEKKRSSESEPVKRINSKPENPIIIPDFNNEQYSSKYKSTNFCQQRTLTVIDDDSFNEPVLKVGTHVLPILSNSIKSNDVSFEEFDDELTLHKKRPDLVGELEKNNDDKENLDDVFINSSPNTNLKEPKAKEGKKVSFSDDTVDTKSSKLIKGKVLVPKNVRYISNVQKK